MIQSTELSIRSITETLCLGSREGRHRALSNTDIDTARAVLAREKKIKERIIASLSPTKNYTLAELEILGIPIAHFAKMIRAGKLQSEGAVATISGKYALEYFQDRYSTHYLSQGLRLVTYFHQHLHTSTDLIEELGISRSTVIHMLNTGFV